MFALALITLAAAGYWAFARDPAPFQPGPPALTFTIGGKTFAARLGSYCWKTGVVGVCGDAPPVQEFLKDQTPIAAMPGQVVRYQLRAGRSRAATPFPG